MDNNNRAKELRASLRRLAVLEGRNRRLRRTSAIKVAVAAAVDRLAPGLLGSSSNGLQK
jgi:hypothetical protein